MDALGKTGLIIKQNTLCASPTQTLVKFTFILINLRNNKKTFCVDYKNERSEEKTAEKAKPKELDSKDPPKEKD
ncbi:kelch repeat-containing F-box family protein [Corchorus capsularis]|uniref:Kelch repeat-containing F-box family protein n=1 Tax=Corchorus capsularis TaxID=210143 RepID=A0A1R3IS53_COCAP|nr:kelch repeat-containing F-box family protein [Corchorus capsularis]